MGQVNGCLVDDRGTWTVSRHDDDSKSIQLIVKGSGNQKTVAVTGANGFIGSHIVNLLLRKGYKVRGTVRPTAQQDKHALVDFLKDLPNAAKNLTLHEKELMDDGCFDDVFQGCDCVFHTASPTLKDQREMKEPHVEMIETAHFGTANVLLSCKKNEVGTVVLTSSMCSAVPKTNLPSGGLPAVIYEKHWANPDFLKKKGSYYAASKTLAEMHAVEMAKEFSARLVRICPSFTVGPMLQPTVNSSMERFARICAGEHHERIPNRSISLVDVRDVAAHHVAAYEKGHHGRFFSTTESWHWTLVYNALQILIPQMKCPKPLPNGTELLRPRKFSTSKMKTLGVTERSLMQVLTDAVEEIKKTKISHGLVQCHEVSALPAQLSYSFLTHAGYYASLTRDGTFFMIDVLTNFKPKQRVSYSVWLSWFFPGSGRSEPACMQVKQISNASFVDGKLVLAVYGISLTFAPTNIGKRPYWNVQGQIEGNEINAISYVLPVPSLSFANTYTASDGSSVTITLGGTNSTITDYQGYATSSFTYNPTKREFEYNTGSGNDTITHQLFLNAAAGYGLRLTFVEFNPLKLPGTTKYFYLSSNFLTAPSGQPPQLPRGANDLAAFVGYYPFQNGGFVSVTEIQEGSSINKTVTVTVNQDGSQSVKHTSFTFDNGTLTIPVYNPFSWEFTLTFQSNFASNFDNSISISERLTTAVTMGQDTAQNYFAPVRLSAFGTYLLKGTDPEEKNQYTLQISDGDNGVSITYTKNGQNVFEPTTTYDYNAVEACAQVGELVFNFTYDANKGLACGVTTNNILGEPNGLQAAVYAFPDAKY